MITSEIHLLICSMTYVFFSTLANPFLCDNTESKANEASKKRIPLPLDDSICISIFQSVSCMAAYLQHLSRMSYKKVKHLFGIHPFHLKEVVERERVGKENIHIQIFYKISLFRFTRLIYLSSGVEEFIINARQTNCLIPFPNKKGCVKGYRCQFVVGVMSASEDVVAKVFQ